MWPPFNSPQIKISTPPINLQEQQMRTPERPPRRRRGGKKGKEELDWVNLSPIPSAPSEEITTSMAPSPTALRTSLRSWMSWWRSPSAGNTKAWAYTLSAAVVIRYWRKALFAILTLATLAKLTDTLLRLPQVQAWLFYRRWASTFPSCDFDSPQIPQRFSRITSLVDKWLPPSLRQFEGLPGAFSLSVLRRKRSKLGTWVIWPSQIPDPRPSCAVLYHHGRLGHRGTRPRAALYLTLARLVRIPVVTFDGRGFADSAPVEDVENNQQQYDYFSGIEPTERTLLEDAHAVWTTMVGSDATGGLGVAPRRVVVWGHGLGSALAANLAVYLIRRGTPPACLVLEAPFTSSSEVVASWLPRTVFGFPIWNRVREYAADVFKHHRYDIEAKVCEVVQAGNVPILILGAEKDEVVPFEHARRLFDLAASVSAALGGGSRVAFQQFDGCRHDNISSHPRFVSVVSSFLDAAFEAADARRPAAKVLQGGEESNANSVLNTSTSLSASPSHGGDAWGDTLDSTHFLF